MTFNIEDFKAEVGTKNGVLRSNRFRIQLTAPIGMNSVETSRSLEFWCSAVQIPGYQLMTHDVRRFTYGTNEARPFAPNFEPLQLQFQADGDGEILHFWHEWMEYIMPHDMSAGINNNNAYLLKYKTDYVTDLKITYFRETGEEVRTINVREAFPININSIPLTWAEQNASVSFAVFIDYLDWYVDTSSGISTPQ